MIPEFRNGDRRRVDPEYRGITLQAWKAKQSGEMEKAKALNKIAQTMPSGMPNDPNFKRLWYVRYADDWLAGVIGTKSEAQTIKTRVADYLKYELKLDLSEEKTLVTHARNEKAKFLGYEVQALHCDTKHTDGQRQVIIPRTGKKSLETHFGAVPLIWNKRAHIDDNREVRIWSKRSEVVQRLLAEQCELCGNKESIEMHHIRKMADIQSKNGKPVAEWNETKKKPRRMQAVP